MKTLQFILITTLTSLFFTSCYYDDDSYYNNYNPEPQVSLNQLLNSYELWYIDINETLGYGEIPFMQMAFTLSFRNGTLYANNNLVGFGSQGAGFGIPVGYYSAYTSILDISHDIDGFTTFDVYQLNYNTIELYNPTTDTSYFLHGYQRANFDYDYIFYDNISYFLQEYEAWEKTFTSSFGAPNEFDAENYLQFLSGGNDNQFRSSIDATGVNIASIYWDYTGVYSINNISGNLYAKHLELDYTNYANSYFKLQVINDSTIKLTHLESGTEYRMEGRGYITYIKVGATKKEKQKFRIQQSKKQENKRKSDRV